MGAVLSKVPVQETKHAILSDPSPSPKLLGKGFQGPTDRYDFLTRSLFIYLIFSYLKKFCFLRHFASNFLKFPLAENRFFGK